MKHITRWLLLLSCLGLLVSSANAKGPSEKLALRTSGIALSSDASPNLTPYKPSAWSDKIVVSKETGTNTDSATLSPADSLYVDLTVLNNGGSATAARFYVELSLDGALNHTWYVDPPLEAGYYGYVEDYALGTLSAGTHTLRVKVDSTNAIAEGDETDNEYTKSFTVGGAAGACVADASTLCLNGGRFRVEVTFQTQSIPNGIGTAVPLTADTGYFWFFSSGNVELAIKVLDGRAFNNKFWVFYGALSDVAYTITVTDTATGAVKTYSNPSGRLASVADTSAFAGLRAPGESGITPLTMAEAATAIWSARPLLAVGPNLTPFKPSAWSDKIVVSRETGTNTDSASLSPADTLSVDWAVINNGTSPTAARFYTELYVDGVLRTTWYTDPPLDLLFYSYVEDYSIGTLPAGTHTLRIKTDSTGAIAEGDETDNEYTKTITVGGGGGGAGVCVADSRTLCLNGGRYQVQVAFQTQAIANGVGNAVSLTADSGYFWFFSSGNVELVVKALDGRAFNDRYWIFYGALSDVAYTIIVTDTVTGEVKIYANPAGNLASVADAAAFPLPAAAPIAHFEIDHPSIGELILGVGVGDPARPSYSLPIAIRAGGARANVTRDVDLRLCAAALPPTASYQWYLEAEDAASGNTGQIRVFRITAGGQTWSAGDTPVSIRDLQKSWSYVPSGVTPTPTTSTTPGVTPTPTPTPTAIPSPGPGPGGNHAPTLDRVDSTRLVHSFGRDDALRSEGVAGRPGFGPLQAALAPRVITFDDNHDGKPDITNAIVVAAANITSCCTLLVAEGALDPDNDPMVYHWQAVVGTFYATGTDSSGGLAFGQKITNLDTYNRNSVFYELPSIGNIILEHTLMGGATTVGAFVTDVRAIPSQSLSSPTRGCSLEWGRTVHLELLLLQSTLLPATHPTHPEGIEMILFANIVGNFLGSELPTYRGEVIHPDGRTVFDQDSTDNGGRIVLRFKRTEKGGTAQIAVVASTSGTSGANPFVKVPVSLSIPILDFWRSRGCTIGDVAVEKIEAKTGIAAIDVWDSGFIADDVFELTVDGVSQGRTPAGGDRLYTNLLLGSGTHNLCVVYVDCTVCNEDGTYTVRLAGSLTFTDGTTERRGNLAPWGTRPRPPYAQACFDFRVP